MTLREVQREPTVYLIPQDRTEPKTYIRRHFKAIFEEELNAWYTDPDMWPKERSFNTFKKFFTVQIGTMVFDLGGGQIIKED